MYWVFEWMISGALMGVSAGLVLWLLREYNAPQPDPVTEVIWMARDPAIKEPEVMGNTIDFSVPKAFLMPSTGGKVFVDLHQYIRLPDAHGGLLTTVDAAFDEDIAAHVRLLEPGWYGDISLMLRSYAEEAIAVQSDTPFVRLTVLGTDQVEVVKLNDKIGG